MSTPQKLHPRIEEVLARIEARSTDTRAAYREMIRARKPEK